MKKSLSFVIILLMFLLTGCGQKPFIIMKSEPVTAQNALYPEQTYHKGERIYFVLVNPKGFKDDALKIEIVKKNDKVPTMGYSIHYAKDVRINKDNEAYADYFVLHSSGWYFMQVFELRRPDKCLARYDFQVK